MPGTSCSNTNVMPTLVKALFLVVSVRHRTRRLVPSPVASVSFQTPAGSCHRTPSGRTIVHRDPLADGLRLLQAGALPKPETTGRECFLGSLWAVRVTAASIPAHHASQSGTPSPRHRTAATAARWCNGPPGRRWCAGD